MVSRPLARPVLERMHIPCVERERDSVHCTTRQTRSHLRGQSRSLPPFPRLSDAVGSRHSTVEAWSPGLLRLHVGPSPFSPLETNRDKRVLSNLSQLAVTAARTQLKALVFLDTCGAPWPGMSVATQQLRVTKIMFSPKKTHLPASLHPVSSNDPHVYVCIVLICMWCRVWGERRDCTAPVGPRSL